MVSAAKDPLTFNDLMATPNDFSKYAMNRLKIDKLTQAHLIGPVYELLKGTCTSNIVLEYNMEECFKALTYRLDWNNPEGDRYPLDLTKPLPLKGRLGRLTVAAKYFFNNDLKFLKSLDLEKKYTTSTTKTKAARYEIVRIEDMTFPGIKFKELCTLSYKPPGVIYEDLKKQKRVMRMDELYKFLDGTLKTVRDELHHRILDFHLGYNKEMSRRKWTVIELRRSELMVKLINNQIRERQIIRNLERLVGARELEMDYKLMTRTELSSDKIEVLRYDTKGVKVRKRKLQTKAELTLEQTQQGVSDEVLVSIEGVKEFKGNVKMKGEKKEALLILRQKHGQYICYH
ncbi:hypothetical protein Tco_0173408 [Tanacetum coccineum]